MQLWSSVPVELEQYFILIFRAERVKPKMVNIRDVLFINPFK